MKTKVEILELRKTQIQETIEHWKIRKDRAIETHARSEQQLVDVEAEIVEAKKAEQAEQAALAKRAAEVADEESNES